HPVQTGTFHRRGEDDRDRRQAAPPAGDEVRARRTGEIVRREPQAPLPLAGGARRGRARGQAMTTRLLEQKDKVAGTASALGAIAAAAVAIFASLCCVGPAVLAVLGARGAAAAAGPAPHPASR